MHILNHWPDYFRDRNEGFGTTYERFILHRHFKQIKDEWKIASVLECPSFGMTGVSGINSMWWASQDVPVTVVDNNHQRTELIKQVWQEVGLPVDLVNCNSNYDSLPFDDNVFDMGWNFASLIFLQNIHPLLSELTRVVKKAIIICIPNEYNPFVAFRIRKERGLSELFFHYTDQVINIMRELNWKKCRSCFLDVPPWPDIAMNKEEMLKRVGLGRLAKQLARHGGPPICILDYFSGRAPSMPDMVFKLDWLENSPEPVKKLWAHHQLMLFTPNKG